MPEYKVIRKYSHYDMTPAELTAEMMSLGVSTRTKTPRVAKQKKVKRKRQKVKKTHPIPSPSELNILSKQACASRPVELGMMPLETLVLGNIGKKSFGGFDSSTRLKPRADGDVYQQTMVRPAENTFTLQDIAEYVGVEVRHVRKAAGLLGYLKRLPGRLQYAAVSVTQAKGLIQHLRLRSARLLSTRGRLAR